MHQITRRVLERLLAHAETEEARGSRAAFNLTDLRAGPYLRTPDLAIKQQVHSDLMELQRAGILTITWDPRAGERGLVKALSAGAPATLAQALGIVRRKDSLEVAARLFETHAPTARLDLALATWRKGLQVRTYGPEDAALLLSVLEAVVHCRSFEAPQAVRRASAQIFGDSKALERLVALVDFFTAATDDEALAPSDCSAAEVLARIQLIRYAQPLLMAGTHRIRLAGGDERSLAVPYEGIAPDALEALVTRPSYVLTVENLTTFHEMATALQEGGEGLIIFTAGNFSPAFAAAYRRLAVTSGCRRFLHWGDVDWKGVEIMGRLDDELQAVAALRLEPFRMALPPVEARNGHAEQLDDRTIARITALCVEHGWPEMAHALSQHRTRVEQESQPLVFPDG